MSLSEDRLARIPNRSLAERAREMIRSAIFEGTIKPDEKLTIEQIAAELGISRTPVREALKSLEADGIIRILPNRGLVVQRFDKEELRQRYALRALLEGYAGEIACQKQGAALADALAGNVEAMRLKVAQLQRGAEDEVGDLKIIGELLELNRAFHLAILQASDCTLVGKVLDSLQMPVAYRLYQWRVPERQQAVIDYHDRIVQAFRAQDARKVRAMLEAHIHDVSDFLMSTAQVGP